MKSLVVTIRSLFISLFIVLAGCSSEDDKNDLVNNEIFKKLKGTWQATLIEKDNITQNTSEHFILGISESKVQERLSYTIENNSYNSIWPSNIGMFFLHSQRPSGSMTRDDGVVIDYSIAEKSLIMYFRHSDSAEGGRVKGIGGNWKFTFIRVGD
ncbi:hypothetical protein [Chryseosolibacter indicus]|uniref:Lipocalin-like domain-containing protein n=1 Tax=Chryseosolibacter indicus TaxID=2782351 RepID=A0ABS5VSH6_9BACT|nr:hypothetical protein [Chryseosolibacter indicus]MBT1703790.1 hypothetical protein [Chryseosolibacter indicus]